MRYIVSALCFVWRSSVDSTSKDIELLPKVTVTTSPTFTSFAGLTTLPLISIRPPSHASCATVRLLITLDTFKNLSILIRKLYYAARDFSIECAHFLTKTRDLSSQQLQICKQPFPNIIPMLLSPYYNFHQPPFLASLSLMKRATCSRVINI